MANSTITNKEEELEKKLGAIRSHGTEDEYKALAVKLNIPFSDLASAPIDTSALSLLSEEVARQARLAIILKSGSQLTIALTNPEDENSKGVIAGLQAKGYKLSLIMTSPKSLEKILARYANLKNPETYAIGSLEIQESEIDALQQQIKNVADLKSQISAVSVTRLLEILIAGALKIGASDIHFEPETGSTRLRYRMDGVLESVTAIDEASYQKVLNRIKVLARLKLNVHGAPQDGRFTIRQQDIDIEVRVSILPSEFGETIVMRLLDPRSIKGSLEDLGMRPDLLTLVKSQLDKPTGAILTTGPTGSGKTTTLYAFVNYLNGPGSKIITIEDPIEYHVAGVSQTQVDPQRGYSFANGLRAIVRQDPDVILVGEIRDAETAEIALNAALTGHLVLSTIHTNDAAGTVPRLIDLKVNPQIIAPAIHVAMAQRLVRKLCPTCRKKGVLSAGDLKTVKEALMPVKDLLGVPDLETGSIYEPVGCKECNGTGYKGRIGVFEVFVVTPEVERLILSNPSISAMQELAIKQGMVTMHQDAYLKLLEGVTSMEEIVRILG